MTATKTRKPARKLTADEIQQKITESKNLLDSAITALLTSDGWERFLRSRKGLRTYSANNLLLVSYQCPGATDVRPYGARNNPQPGSWKYIGRYAKPGEKAIRIFAPLFRKNDEGERVIYGFKLVPVFDVSQTDGEPLPPTPEGFTPIPATGDAPAKLWDEIEKLVIAEGFHVVRGDRDDDAAEGRTTWASREVWVKGTENDAFSTSTLIHELAHIMCEHETRDVPPGQAEVEAESVAFIVGDVAGMTTLAYSVPYGAGWAGDTETVAASAKTVLTVTDKILKAIGLEIKKS